MQGYASAKSGILGLTRAQAVSLDKKVRVNTVLPGWIVTPGSQARLTQDIHDWHLTGTLLDCALEAYIIEYMVQDRGTTHPTDPGCTSRLATTGDTRANSE